ncbi:PAP2-domain-containing protein [Fomitopsis serialis]|uniref:PAP2-domain-containing protein n=1 Tax=Fomitopsis serialis TaxID=139415 RepID=UPI0020074C77|nr:PAP2-domain-containing protein [Neoantrodia serialis]KAH9937336.1 PAP2-domain-containing protein [Neoantrodia serialis]
MTHTVVTGITACFVLYTRSAGVAYFAAGAVLCSMSVKVIKRCVRQPRPVQVIRGKRKKSYGMPSTHSATITFFAAYIALACLYLPIHPTLPSSPFTRVLPIIISIPWAVTIVVSRIWLGHHNVPQVIAGCACGLVLAPLWFNLWTHGANDYSRALEHALFGQR